MKLNHLETLGDMLADAITEARRQKRRVRRHLAACVATGKTRRCAFSFGSGIELEHAAPREFLPCKGALGFFKPVLESEVAK